MHHTHPQHVDRSILFRCDASPGIGLGHVMRCLAIAEQFRSRHGLQSVFMTRTEDGDLGSALISSRRFPVIRIQAQSHENDVAEISNAAREYHAAALFVDVRHGLSRSNLETLRGRALQIVCLDDVSDRRLAADWSFHPPEPRIDNLDWAPFKGQRRVGWDWTVLGCAPITGNPTNVAFGKRSNRSNDTSILVSMGGSDPAGMTLKVVDGLDRAVGSFNTSIVLGPGYGHHTELDQLMGRCHRKFEVLETVPSLVDEARRSDLAIVSFGVSAFEVASAGVPAIHLCLTDGHNDVARLFEETGMTINLGVHTAVSPDRIARAAETLIADRPRLLSMGTIAAVKVDGLGARRISDLIVQSIYRT